jgi:hypothetical protein
MHLRARSKFDDINNGREKFWGKWPLPRWNNDGLDLEERFNLSSGKLLERKLEKVRKMMSSIV